MLPQLSTITAGWSGCLPFLDMVKFHASCKHNDGSLVVGVTIFDRDIISVFPMLNLDPVWLIGEAYLFPSPIAYI